jgi:hypothetical protein
VRGDDEASVTEGGQRTLQHTAGALLGVSQMRTCGLGACGCVASCIETLTAAWRDAGPTESEAPGFVVQSPRPESQLARAGVQGGELVLAVDGHQVRTFAEIQAVIRKHALGDEVRLLIQRSSESPRELKVQHVSDYLKT